MKTAAIWLFLLTLGVAMVRAEPAAKATLSSSETTVGEPVELRVQITGANRLSWSGGISVNGLSISGPRTSHSFGFGQGFSEAATLVFVVDPERAGTFTIPPLHLQADGRAVETEPLQLVVKAATAGSGSATTGEIAFAELVTRKKTAYVGEMVEVELRVHVDSRVRRDLEERPQIEGEGFTQQKLSKPRAERARKDGREYDVFVFRTAITPSKAGKLAVGPSRIDMRVQIPEPRRNRPRSLLDDFLGDDFFSSNPMFSPVQTKRLQLHAEAVELDVKPLPAAGKPPAYSGAIGEFKLTAEGSPDKVKIGDPITMRLMITGQGNFDRVNAPAMLEAAGWHAYPPTSDFKPDHDLGLSGTKTFEMAVIPETKKSAMPVYEFSYFDPEAGKYVVLKTEAIRLDVEGAAPPPPSPVAPDAGLARSAARAAATPAPTDILGLRYESNRPRKSFAPLYSQRTFWAAQAVPAAALLGFIVWRLRRRSDESVRVARLRHEKAELWRRLQREEAPAEFFELAARWVRAETALATGRAEASVDADVARASRPLDPSTAETIEEIFNARAELLYAGVSRDRDSLAAQDRERVMAAMERFEKAHAR